MTISTVGTISPIKNRNTFFRRALCLLALLTFVLTLLPNALAAKTAPKSVTLDLHEMIAPIRIDAKVGDTARELEISFLERGLPWAIPAGTTATISDGTTTDTTFSASGETVTWNERFIVDEDKITYRLNGAFTASEGTKKLEFKLIGTDGVLYTSTFMLNVYGKVTPDVDPEILTPTTLDDLDEMLQGLQTALEDIDSLKAQGYLITGLTVNENYQLVVTMENVEGTEWVYTSESLKGEIPILTLEWTYEPDDSIKAANVAAVLKATQNPGAYDIRIKKGSTMIPALTVTANSVMGISLQDGASLRAYQFTGTSVSNYRQITWSYINVGEFDDMSESAASQMSIAEYVEGKLAGNTSAITVRGEDPALPVPAQILTESQDAALTPEERAARVLYFVVEDDPEGT